MSPRMLVLSFLSLALHSLATPLERRQAPSNVPQYVVDYAPMVYLYTEETYLPSDIGTQLVHTTPDINFTAITGAPSPLTLNNLNSLNDVAGGDGGADVYLTSKQPPWTNPAWFNGVKPDSSGKTDGAISCAIIVNNYGGGYVDAFYMYFYAFNFGGTYYTFTVDDHVGDWEHNMIRFYNGVPQAVWFSQHSNGEAFTYDCLTKYEGGLRPVVFSANGSHANYATPGTHFHLIPDLNLPYGPFSDHTNQGPLWDPTLSAYYVTYDASNEVFSPYDSSTPVNWLYFLGAWGNDQYPTSNPHQSCPLGISALCKYSSGPTGPIDKDLNRTLVCPDDGDPCIIRTQLGP